MASGLVPNTERIFIKLKPPKKSTANSGRAILSNF